MALIDLKNCTLRVVDGAFGTGTITIAGDNNNLTLTSKVRHSTIAGAVSLTLVDPGANDQAIAVSVSGRDITVDLATGPAGAITSTAADVVAAIEADTDADALITAVAEGTGLGLVTAKTITRLTGTSSKLAIKVGNGTVAFTEHSDHEYVPNQGLIETGFVRDADEEPIDLKIDALFEFIKSDIGGGEGLTIDEFLNQENAGSSLISTGGSSEPYAVDVEVVHDTPCSVDDEAVAFEDFRVDTTNYDPKAGTLSITGQCNVTRVRALRY